MFNNIKSCWGILNNDYYKKSSWEVTKLEGDNVKYECPKGHKIVDYYGC